MASDERKPGVTIEDIFRAYRIPINALPGLKAKFAGVDEDIIAAIAKATPVSIWMADETNLTIQIALRLKVACLLQKRDLPYEKYGIPAGAAAILLASEQPAVGKP